MSRRSYTYKTHGLPDGYRELAWIATKMDAAFTLSFGPRDAVLHAWLAWGKETESYNTAMTALGVYYAGRYEWRIMKYAANNASHPNVLSYHYSPSSGDTCHDMNYQYGLFLQEINGGANKTTLKFDSTTTVLPVQNSNLPSSDTIAIGSGWDKGSNAFFAVRDYYQYLGYIALYNNTTLRYELIPALRRSDGKAGMYDLVNSVFHPSETSVDFVAGPPV